MIRAGVYIFQNTMVGGGGKKMAGWGKKRKLKSWGKKRKKGKEKGGKKRGKREEKKGKKALKMHLLGS